MKKKLLVILGSGSSISLKLPSVADLDDLMKQWAQEWTMDKPGCPNYFDALWKATASYYNLGPTSSIRPQVNFEKVLGDMTGLAHWMSPAPWGDTLRQVTCRGALPPDLPFLEPNGYVPKIFLTDQLSLLSARLVGHMRGLCKKPVTPTEAAEQYRSLFENLRRSFEIGIFNLNYDTAALSFWPDAYTGFSKTGLFEPSRVHELCKWNFIYHLHGSVHHSLTGPSSEDICWRRTLDEQFFDGNPGSPMDRRSDGRSFPKTTLIAGGYKLDQLLVEPFHSFHAALIRHCHMADAILIGGYGFGDVHVNRALRNRLIGPRARPPVMVLAYADNKTESIRIRRDLWSVELLETLAANDWFFSEPGGSLPRTPFNLARTGAFEVETQHHVALWYGRRITYWHPSRISRAYKSW